LSYSAAASKGLPNTSGVSIVAAANKPTVAQKPSTGNKVIGRAPSNVIKGITNPISEKSVFSIYNVAAEYDVEDIKKHCKQLDIRVLFCFSITKSNHSSKSFKLAVAKQDEHRVLSSESWPTGVVVRPWKYAIIPSTQQTNGTECLTVIRGTTTCRPVLSSVNNPLEVGLSIENLSTNQITAISKPTSDNKEGSADVVNILINEIEPAAGDATDASTITTAHVSPRNAMPSGMAAPLDELSSDIHVEHSGEIESL